MVTESQRKSQQERALTWKAQKQSQGKFGGIRESGKTLEALRKVYPGREYMSTAEGISYYDVKPGQKVSKTTQVSPQRISRFERLKQIGVVQQRPDMRAVTESPIEYQRRRFQEVLALEKTREEQEKYKRLQEKEKTERTGLAQFYPKSYLKGYEKVKDIAKTGMGYILGTGWESGAEREIRTQLEKDIQTPIQEETFEGGRQLRSEGYKETYPEFVTKKVSYDWGDVEYKFKAKDVGGGKIEYEPYSETTLDESKIQKYAKQRQLELEKQQPFFKRLGYEAGLLLKKSHYFFPMGVGLVSIGGEIAEQVREKGTGQLRQIPSRILEEVTTHPIRTATTIGMGIGIGYLGQKIISPKPKEFEVGVKSYSREFKTRDILTGEEKPVRITYTGDDLRYFKTQAKAYVTPKGKWGKVKPTEVSILGEYEIMPKIQDKVFSMRGQYEGVIWGKKPVSVVTTKYDVRALLDQSRAVDLGIGFTDKELIASGGFSQTFWKGEGTSLSLSSGRILGKTLKETGKLGKDIPQIKELGIHAVREWVEPVGEQIGKGAWAKQIYQSDFTKLLGKQLGEVAIETVKQVPTKSILFTQTIPTTTAKTFLSIKPQKQEQIDLLKQKQPTKVLQREAQKQVQQVKQQLKQIQKQQQKQRQQQRAEVKQQQKESILQLIGLKQLQRQKQQQKQMQKQLQLQRQLQRQSIQQKQLIPTPFLTPSPKVRREKALQSALKKILGWEVYGKRFGKEIKISSKAMPKWKAGLVGERWARETLGATFLLKPSKKFVFGKEKPYIPSKIFRQYRKKGGQIIPLSDVFIQKAKFRLGTLGEIKEIQRAKRQKTPSFWFK